MKRTVSLPKPWHVALALLLFLVFVQVGFAGPLNLPRYEVGFADVSGYQTLVCDLHMHTVFSDGNVWPSVRVDEAWRCGLDMFAITDHIEHQPHRADVPTNHNRPTDMVVEDAAKHGLLFAKGAEITRDTPPGHYNAIFLQDVTPLDTPDFLTCIEAANQQGAFVFWNHHDWKGEEKGNWTELQDTMLEKKWLHGMEVANGEKYYPRAHQWCLEKGLTMVGNSDIHHPDLRLKSTGDDHRSLTLVFAKERTLESIKEALREGRTAVWHNDLLIGREAQLAPLFAASVEFAPIHTRKAKTAWLKVRNNSPMDLQLLRTGKVGPINLTLPAGSTTLLSLYVPKKQKEISLDYTVENFLIAPEKGLPVSIAIRDGTASVSEEAENKAEIKPEASSEE